MEKRELRRSLLKIRREIPSELWQRRSLQICDQVKRCSWFREAKTVLAYFSDRQEPDLSALFCLSKTWGFSRCVDQELHWHAWSPTDSLPLETGLYGILQPSPDAPLIAPDAVDLILVPAVACDRQGYRLGYGAGFYDRLLSDPAWSHKPTIGIVFDFASLPQLPTDPWDQPLKGICTEFGCCSTANRHA